SSVDAEQYQALLKFKKTCMDRGLIETYESVTEFREKLSRQLAQTVIHNFPAVRALDSSDVSAVSGSIAGVTPTLSDSARELLIEAANDGNGVIMQLRSLAGLH